MIEELKEFDIDIIEDILKSVHWMDTSFIRIYWPAIFDTLLCDGFIELGHSKYAVITPKGVDLLKEIRTIRKVLCLTSPISFDMMYPS